MIKNKILAILLTILLLSSCENYMSKWANGRSNSESERIQKEFQEKVLEYMQKYSLDSVQAGRRVKYEACLVDKKLLRERGSKLNLDCDYYLTHSA